MFVRLFTPHSLRHNITTPPLLVSKGFALIGGTTPPLACLERANAPTSQSAAQLAVSLALFAVCVCTYKAHKTA